MSNSWFQFKQFTIHQERSAMKVTTDACLFGAWVAERVGSLPGSRQVAQPAIRKILDIGTGTGLLSLMLAQKVNALLDAIEIDKDAFEQAKENVGASPWADRIKIFYADAREHSLFDEYDFIVSNPPFYENELRSPVEKKNIAHHDGLGLKGLLEITKKNLSIAGTFFLLLPYKRDIAIDKLVDQMGLSLTQKTLVRQSVNHEPFRIMIAGEHGKEKEMIRDELAIRNAKDQYTDAFISLLKDYYLKL